MMQWGKPPRHVQYRQSECGCQHSGEMYLICTREDSNHREHNPRQLHFMEGESVKSRASMGRPRCFPADSAYTEVHGPIDPNLCASLTSMFDYL